WAPTPLRTMARMTALRPGQSPPPVSTPIRMIASLRVDWATPDPTRRAAPLPAARWSPQLSTLAGGTPRARHGPPARQVVPRVHERVVPPSGGLRQGGLARVVPQLPQLLGEPGDLRRQLRHRAPQLGERHVVVRGEPRPQLDRLTGAVPQRSDHELPQVVPDLGPAPPGRVPGGGQLVQDVAAHPRHGPARVELGGDGVELPAVLIHHADR